MFIFWADHTFSSPAPPPATSDHKTKHTIPKRTKKPAKRPQKTRHQDRPIPVAKPYQPVSPPSIQSIGRYTIYLGNIQEIGGNIHISLKINHNQNGTTPVISNDLTFELKDPQNVRHPRQYRTLAGDPLDVRLSSGGSIQNQIIFRRAYTRNLELIVDLNGGFGFTAQTIRLGIPNPPTPNTQVTTVTTPVPTDNTPRVIYIDNRENTNAGVTCDEVTDRANTRETQKYLGVTVDGQWGPITQSAYDKACDAK